MADDKLLVLPANVCVDDLPVGPGGAWDWLYEVVVLGKAGRLQFQGLGRRATPEELEQRAVVLRAFARSMDLLAGVQRATGDQVGSSRELALVVLRAAGERCEPVDGVELVCGTCGVVLVGGLDQVECSACASPIDPAAARERAVASDATPVPPAPDAAEVAEVDEARADRGLPPLSVEEQAADWSMF